MHYYPCTAAGISEGIPSAHAHTGEAHMLWRSRTKKETHTGTNKWVAWHTKSDWEGKESQEIIGEVGR